MCKQSARQIKICTTLPVRANPFSQEFLEGVVGENFFQKGLPYRATANQICTRLPSVQIHFSKVSGRCGNFFFAKAKKKGRGSPLCKGGFLSLLTFCRRTTRTVQILGQNRSSRGVRRIYIRRAPRRTIKNAHPRKKAGNIPAFFLP